MFDRLFRRAEPTDVDTARHLAELMRRLARLTPRFERDHATALLILARRLTEADRLANAIATGADAIAVGRRAAARSPERATYNLGLALVDQTFRHIKREDYRDGLPCATEAVEVLGRSVPGAASRSQRPLGQAHLARAVCLSYLARWDDALESVGPAAAIFRKLATAREQGARVAFASVLEVQATILTEVGQYEEAALARWESSMVQDV